MEIALHINKRTLSITCGNGRPSVLSYADSKDDGRDAGERLWARRQERDDASSQEVGDGNEGERELPHCEEWRGNGDSRGSFLEGRRGTVGGGEASVACDVKVFSSIRLGMPPRAEFRRSPTVGANLQSLRVRPYESRQEMRHLSRERHFPSVDRGL
jgi:hypothetical protein